MHDHLRPSLLTAVTVTAVLVVIAGLIWPHVDQWYYKVIATKRASSLFLFKVLQIQASNELLEGREALQLIVGHLSHRLLLWCHSLFHD